MTRFAKYLAAAAAVGGFAAPALAQTYPYPQPYPQQSYPQQAYPQSGYGYPQQGYGSTNPIQGIIDQLLGNRYNVTDRTAVRQCATAAVAQASAQYRQPGYGQGYAQPYGQAYGYNQPYPGYPGQGYQGQYANAHASARVTAITNVERRSRGLRVSGLLSSAHAAGAYAQQGYGNYGGYPGQPGYSPYGGQQGYNPAYAQGTGDLTFRCNVDYRGVVTDVRVRRNPNWRRPY